MSNTTVAVISIVVVLLVAAGVLLHPQSPLTIIYLLPSDIYQYVVRIVYTGRHPRPHPNPGPHHPKIPVNPSPEPSPANFVPENNGYKPGLGPLFPASGLIPASYTPSATNFLPVNPNNNVTPYSPPLDPTRPAFKAIEPSHAKDLHPYMLL
jgi:hypothetical protein